EAMGRKPAPPLVSTLGIPVGHGAVRRARRRARRRYDPGTRRGLWAHLLRPLAGPPVSSPAHRMLRPRPPRSPSGDAPRPPGGAHGHLLDAGPGRTLVRGRKL